MAHKIKQIKYQLGPTYSRAHEFDVGVRISYFTNGLARLRLTWFKDAPHSDSMFVDTFSRHVTVDVGAQKVKTLMDRLTEAGFYTLRSRGDRSIDGKGRYQVLKVYRPAPHEVVAQNYAFPREVREVIAELRSPFEGHLPGYKDPNRHFARNGRVLPPYVREEPVESAVNIESSL